MQKEDLLMSKIKVDGLGKKSKNRMAYRACDFRVTLCR